MKIYKNSCWGEILERKKTVTITALSSLCPGRQKHPTIEVFIHLFVALQHRRSDEGLLAQVTLVLFVAVVNHLDVHVERVLPLEGGVALVALKRPLACSRGTKGHAAICSYLLSGTLNTQSSRAASRRPISPRGECAGGKCKKENVPLHQDNPTQCSCLGLLFFLFLRI